MAHVYNPLIGWREVSDVIIENYNQHNPVKLELGDFGVMQSFDEESAECLKKAKITKNIIDSLSSYTINLSNKIHELQYNEKYKKDSSRIEEKQKLITQLNSLFNMVSTLKQ